METTLGIISKKYYEEALDKLISFLKINSIYDEKTISEDAPFGKGVKEALDYIASLALENGFNVDYCDHYCTEISYGEGKLLDIYAHADVVPVSADWVHSPFEPVIENGKLYARGSSDDKGPAIAAFYALKMLKDLDLIKGYKVRLVIGGNEERGSACLEHYFHSLHKEYPSYGFTPDGDFPLIYGEKGIFTYIAKYDIGDRSIPNFEFGEATNIVLADASISLDDKDLEDFVNRYQAEHKEVKLTLEGNKVTFKGRACHGSLPWEGVNAGLHLLNFLGDIKDNKVLKKIFVDYEKGDGKAIKGDYKSKYFDSSSYCIGKMKYEDGVLSFFVNMRLPENVTSEVAIENVKNMTKADEVKYLGGSEALLVDPESNLIKLLLQAYQEETNDYESKILAIGGGTYARESKNSVAFGCCFPGVDNKIHDNDEFINIDEFNKSIAIYAHGILSLGQDLAKDKRWD